MVLAKFWLDLQILKRPRALQSPQVQGAWKHVCVCALDISASMPANEARQAFWALGLNTLKGPEGDLLGVGRGSSAFAGPPFQVFF